MSNESFARGFCKIAEAHGVDSVALAKFAQQYKTDGWAPAPKVYHRSMLDSTGTPARVSAPIKK